MSENKEETIKCNSCGGKYKQTTGKSKHLLTSKHKRSINKDEDEEEIKIDDEIDLGEEIKRDESEKILSVKKIQKIQSAMILLEVREQIEKSIEKIFNFKPSVY